MLLLRRTCLAGLVASIAFGCGGSTDGSPAGPGAKTAALTIVAGRGIVAVPGASSAIAKGTKVNYAFTPQAGFTRVRVLLDGTDASTSGTLQMDVDHTLVASADSVITLSQRDSAGILAARSILTSPDPAKILAAQYEIAFRDADSRGIQAAATTIGHVATFAFDPKTDAVAEAGAMSKMSGQYFDIDVGLPSSNSLSNATSAAASALPITIIFVNGINTNPMEAIDDMLWLRDLVSKAGLPGYSASTFRVKHFYNATSSARSGEAAFCRLAAISIVIDAGFAPLGAVAFINGACGILADLTRAALDIAELIDWLPVSSPEATGLSGRIAAERREGRGVIVVGHSQGTLIAQNAAKILLNGSSDLNTTTQKCIGFVSLAGPSPDAFVFRHQQDFYVQGLLTKDIILFLVPGRQGIPTTMAADADGSTAFWKALGLVGWTDVYFGIQLHGIKDYLKASPMRESVQQSVRNQVASIQTDCTPPPANLNVVTQPTATGSNLIIDPPPAVQIRDADGNRVASSSATVTVALSNGSSVLTGTRTVQAINGVATFSDLRVSAPGTYQLQFSSSGLPSTNSSSFTVSPPPCIASAVSFPFSLTGDLRSSQCQVLGLTSQTYDFSIASQRAIRLRLSNNSFVPQVGLYVRDRSQGQFITSTSVAPSSMLFLLAPGQYTGVASATGGALSPFTFEGVSASESATGCESIILLRPSLMVTNQSLGTGDCVYGGAFADVFSIGGSKGCSITMRSTSFDTYLEVYDGSGNLIASDDDSGGGSDSKVTLASCYSGSNSTFLFDVSVHATSYLSGATGPYTLEFRFDLPSAIRGSINLEAGNRIGSDVAAQPAVPKAPKLPPTREKKRI